MVQITCPRRRSGENAGYDVEEYDMNAIDQSRPAEAPDAAGLYRIWPGDGRAPGSESWTHRESTMQIPWAVTERRLTRNVVVPTITAFLPKPGRGQRHGDDRRAGRGIPFPDDRP
jgi:hypothetical protein